MLILLIIIGIVIALGLGVYMHFGKKKESFGSEGEMVMKNLSQQSRTGSEFDSRKVFNISRERLRNEEDERAIRNQTFRKLQNPVHPKIGDHRFNNIGRDRAGEILGIEIPQVERFDVDTNKGLKSYRANLMKQVMKK